MATTTVVSDDCKTEMIPLTSIVSNTAQSRGMGVLSNLCSQGWGLFEKASMDVDKGKPIWELLLSESPEERKQGIKLIDDYEPQICDLADGLSMSGQLQPIGVRAVKDGWDVIFGMRRVLAVAYNYALDPTKSSGTIQAKIVEKKMGTVDLLLLALDENDNREDESPIDKAITFQRLRKEGKMNFKEIAKKIRKSDQYVSNYCALLDPKIEDKKLDIHFGRLSVEGALDLLRKRKAERNAEPTTRSTDQKRYRLHSVKNYVKLLEAKEKPKSISDKEWDFLKDPTVRKYLSFKLGLKFKEYKESVAKPEPKTSANGGEKTKPAKAVPVLKVKRERAKQLLISIGQVQARNWEDTVLKNKLENMPNQLEKDQKAETPSLQSLLEKLVAGFGQGLSVTIIDD